MSDQPTMYCPQCDMEYPDYDGFGVQYCDRCGYCTHPSITGGKCDLCKRLEKDIDNERITTDFLRESNAIEEVFDDDSLKHARFAWDYLRKQKEVDVYVVMKTHKILMRNQNLEMKHLGYFRTVPVWVGGREGLPWYVLPEAMEVWCQNANLFSKNWKEHHVRFEVIHPFIDGNGRVGRMLMNWERLKAKLPILVIKASERGDYYEWFNEKENKEILPL